MDRQLKNWAKDLNRHLTKNTQMANNNTRRDSTLSVIEGEGEVTQSCPTLCNPMDCSPPGSSVHGIFKARILEWVAISFSKELQIMTRDHYTPMLMPKIQKFDNNKC